MFNDTRTVLEERKGLKNDCNNVLFDHMRSLFRGLLLDPFSLQLTIFQTITKIFAKICFLLLFIAFYKEKHSWITCSCRMTCRFSLYWWLSVAENSIDLKFVRHSLNTHMWNVIVDLFGDPDVFLECILYCFGDTIHKISAGWPLFTSQKIWASTIYKSCMPYMHRSYTTMHN